MCDCIGLLCRTWLETLDKFSYDVAQLVLQTWREIISISKVLARGTNSTLPQVVWPCVHMFLINIGCIGHHVTSSLSAHVKTISETFFSNSPYTGMQEKEYIMHVRHE